MSDYEYEEYEEELEEESIDEWYMESTNLNERYVESLIPVFIDVSEFSTTVNFDLRNLDPKFLQSILINPDEEMTIMIKHLDGRPNIENIMNAGLLSYQLKDIMFRETVCERLDPTCLKRIVEQSLYRLNNPSKYCVICQKDLGGAGTRPVYCLGELCQFKSTELGLIGKLDDFLTKEPQLVSLLSAFLNTAVNNRLASKLARPFPERIMGLSDLSFNQKSKIVSGLLNKFPNWAHPENVTEKELFQIDSDLPYLIRWVMASCRAALRVSSRDELPKELREIRGEHFIEVISDTPERHEIFETRKQEFGTAYGYHGSNGENWWSIIHNSLQNYSKTDLQRNGAVHGEGIYLAPKLQTALDYSRIGLSLEGSVYNEFRVYLIAEIINRNLKIYGDNFCYVIPDDLDVSIKYIVLYGS